MTNLLEPREAYMPFEYPIFEDFSNLIEDTHWIHRELDFNRDIQDFKVTLTDTEKHVIEIVLKSFAQTELVVEDFWLLLPKHIQKPEFKEMCVKFAENETRHARAYARLNEKLNIENFDEFLGDPIAMERFENLVGADELKKDSVTVYELISKIMIFSAITENVLLFSQFAIMLSFSRRGLLVDVGNIIAWSQKDEQLHANAGMSVVNILLNENKDIDRKRLETMFTDASKLALKTERKLIKEIFSKGELVNLSFDQLDNFMKDRINSSAKTMGFKNVYKIDEKLLDEMSWFDEESKNLEHTDFFHSRPTEYTKNETKYGEDDLF